jgi:hypothetical protein
MLGAVINSLFDGRLILKGENPLGSEANLVTVRENRPCARASNHVTADSPEKPRATYVDEVERKR